MPERSDLERLTIYLVAGIDMDENMLQPLAEALRQRFAREGLIAIPRCVTPYGEQAESAWKQLQTARRDIRLYPEQAERSVGGGRVRRSVRALGALDPMLLIGCGWGGAAAYHAAELLETEGADVRFIVQIGSPKVAIGDRFRDRVGFIARKGSLPEGNILAWQDGWSHAKYRFASHRYPGLLYNAREKGRSHYAPGNVALLDFEGSYASYFSPKAGRGAVSNLAKMTNQIVGWLSPSGR